MVVALEAAFYAVFGATLITYLRRRRPLERDVAAVFGAVAALLALQFLHGRLPGGPATVADIGVALLICQPYLTLRVVGHFHRLPRAVRLGSLALLVATLALYVGGSVAHGLAAKVADVPIALYFFGSEALAVVYLAQEALRRVGVARARLATAAVASALFGAAILVSAIGGTVGESATQVVALAAAAGYLFAFVPPAAVRRLGQRAAAYGFVRELTSESDPATAERLWQQLAAAAQQITGAGAALVLAPGPGGPFQLQATSGSEASLALALIASEKEVAVIDGLEGPVSAMSSGGHLVRIPLQPDDQAQGMVACYLTGNPLFAEDDVALVELFGALTLRMVDRTRLTDDLRRANASLAQASAAKSEFLAAMSHELRTPLNAVIGFSELLQDPQDASNPALTLEFAGHIRDAGMHLLDLINDVLDLSKVEAGRLELRREKIDLATITSQTIESMRPIAERKHITVQLEGPESLTAWADPGRVRQVVYNLLSNALKFTPESGRVTVRLDAGEAEVCLSVTDTGPGIPENDRERIFEAFVQGQLGGAQTEGTGLGLALTRRLVELHEGRLELESALGSGSEFRVVLPSLAPPAETRSSPILSRLAEPTDGGCQRVLVIEDDPNVSRLLEIYLVGAGYLVEVAPSGEAGLARAEATHFDAILLDVLLTGIDGWQVLTSLKAHARTREVPVLVVSVVDDREFGLALGAVDYLVKPINRDALLSAMARIKVTQAPARAESLVLSIDDDPAALRLYEAALHGSGFEFLGAAGGAAGLRLARMRKPGCILLDLLMPGLDGFEVLGRLKADPETARIPVIVITAARITAEEKRRLNGQVLAVVEKGDGALTGLGTWLAQAVSPSRQPERV